MLDAFFEDEDGDPKDIVAKGYVLRDDLNSLFLQRPINDTLLDGWRDTFHGRILEPQNPTAAIVPIRFYNALMSRYTMHNYKHMYNYTSVKRWTLRLGDIFALDRLFVPLIVAFEVPTTETGIVMAFVTIDMNAHSLTYCDPYLRASDDAVMKILKNLRRWLGDEHLCKKGIAIDLSTWSLVTQPIGLPQAVTQMTAYSDDGVFVVKAIECLSRGEPLSFTDDMMPDLRRHIALEILTGRMVHDNVRRRARVNVLALFMVAKLSVMAIRARKRAWEPESVNVVALGANFLARSTQLHVQPLPRPLF